jgi:hypothetical protein
VIEPAQDHITEIFIEQVLQMHISNELWAIDILEHTSKIFVLPIPGVVKDLLHFIICSKSQLTCLLLEIERQVTEMLKTGIITVSVSSFASPILLVKKKDGKLFLREWKLFDRQTKSTVWASCDLTSTFHLHRFSILNPADIVHVIPMQSGHSEGAALCWDHTTTQIGQYPEETTNRLHGRSKQLTKNAIANRD